MTSDVPQHELEAWLRGRDVPPADVEASTREVLARTSDQGQRRPIWPPTFLRRGRAPGTTPGSAPAVAPSRMPTLALTAWVAVIVLIGALLSTQASDIDDAIELLPAAGIEVAPDVERVVEGRMALGVITTPFTISILDTERKTAYGERREGPIFEMSDDRLSGTVVTVVNMDDYRGSGIVGTVVLRIENERGAWQGRPYTALSLVNGREWSAPSVIVLDGEGDYAGLTAVLEAAPYKPFAGEPGGIRLSGLIVDGSLPPAADVASDAR